jgi:hypothetical protein
VGCRLRGGLPGGSHDAEWNITVSGDAAGEHVLSATAVHTADGAELVTRGDLRFTIG